MITYVSLMTTISLIILLSSANPVKMAMAALAIMGSNFYFVSESMGYSWFALLFSLLFSGGILIMFMIISSLLPNEKSKSTNIVFFLFILVLIVFFIHWTNYKEEEVANIKVLVLMGTNISTMIMILTIYFFILTQILKKKTSPLRTLECC